MTAIGKSLTLGNALSNSNRAAKPAVLNGMRLMFVTRYQAEEELHAGLLVPVLADFIPVPLAVHLVYPHRAHMKAGVKLVLQFLQRRLGTVQ